MTLYRISKKEYINDLSGIGAMLFGGRWNLKGVKALYTSGSVSLSVLEVIANLSADKINLGLYVAEIDFPDKHSIQLVEDLPINWNTYPYTYQTVKLGTQFLKSGELCLKVPSAIVTTEFNYILNPSHGDFMDIRIKDVRPLILDKRLFV